MSDSRVVGRGSRTVVDFSLIFYDTSRSLRCAFTVVNIKHRTKGLM